MTAELLSADDYKKRYNREYHKHRYVNDPEYRQRKIEQARKQVSAPDYNEKRRRRSRIDASFRQKEAARHRRWAAGGSLPVPIVPHSNELKQMLSEQGFVCKICSVPFDETTRPQIDHCHKSGVVRGALCVRCNTGLGKFKDSPELLRAATAYLENSQ